MVRRWIHTSGVWLALMLAAVPASAQIVQSVNVGGGWIWPRGFESRVAGDTIVANLSSSDPLVFDIDWFDGGQVFGEWNVAFGDRLEVSGGISYYQQTVPSYYRDFFNDATGFPVSQDLKLRMMPITGIVRFLPVGRPSSFQPYVGGGFAVVNWKYSEAGEFVATDECTPDGGCPIFAASFVESSTDLGAVFVMGARVPIGGDIYGLTFEYRYQWAEGETGGIDNGFLGPKIDLSAASFNIGFLIRF